MMLVNKCYCKCYCSVNQNTTEAAKPPLLMDKSKDAFVVFELQTAHCVRCGATRLLSRVERGGLGRSDVLVSLSTAPGSGRVTYDICI